MSSPLNFNRSEFVELTGWAIASFLAILAIRWLMVRLGFQVNPQVVVTALLVPLGKYALGRVQKAQAYNSERLDRIDSRIDAVSVEVAEVDEVRRSVSLLKTEVAMLRVALDAHKEQFSHTGIAKELRGIQKQCDRLDLRLKHLIRTQGQSET